MSEPDHGPAPDPDAPPDEEVPPRVAFMRALRVPRNAKVGAVVGLLLAVAAYVVRVAELLGPFRGTQRYPVIGVEGWFLVLAFVLATSTALLVAALLTTVRAVRLARDVDEGDRRR